MRLAVCKESEFAIGAAHVVAVHGRDVAVFRTADGFFAIDDCCPHAGASLAGGHVDQGTVTCPWHYWRFRLADGAWVENPKIRTRSYSVAVADGVVYVLATPLPEGGSCGVSQPACS